MLGVNHDITQRKKAEEELLRLNRLYDVLSRVSHLAMTASNFGEFLEKVCQAISQKGQFKLAWIGRLEGAKTKS